MRIIILSCFLLTNLYCLNVDDKVSIQAPIPKMPTNGTLKEVPKEWFVDLRDITWDPKSMAHWDRNKVFPDNIGRIEKGNEIVYNHNYYPIIAFWYPPNDITMCNIRFSDGATLYQLTLKKVPGSKRSLEITVNDLTAQSQRSGVTWSKDR